ncbi:MAG: iron ABC transporter permease [Flavobacteriales bacterium]|nr:iron ABC transporter permease [Flavobacteriales bacterium]
MSVDVPWKGKRLSLLFTLISLLALLLAAPLVVVLVSPVLDGVNEWEHVRQVILPNHLSGTLELLVGVLVVAFALAVPAAWLVATCNFPGRRAFRWALILPLAMPTYIGAFAWAAILGPTSSLSNWCSLHLGIRPDIMNTYGLWFVLGAVLYPYVYLPARALFAHGLQAPIEAARSLGAGPARRFFRVALPLARPAIAGGLLLVAMETLNDYGAVKYYGVATLTTGIFRSWGGLYDLVSALRLSLSLLALVAFLIWLERRSRGRARITGGSSHLARIQLQGPYAIAATAACGLLLTVTLFIPLGKLIGDVLVPGALAAWDELLPALGNTAWIAGQAALFVLALSILFAFRDRYRLRSDLAIRLARLGYAVPGAVIAVAVMALAGAVDRQQWALPVLIGSGGVLVYAFALRFLAVGLQTLDAGLGRQSLELDASARSLGASPWRAFRAVNLPLLRPSLMAAALLVAIDVIKELPLTLILRPFNFETLSTKAYQLASIEQLREASLHALFIVLCGLVPILFLDRLLDRSHAMDPRRNGART